MAKSRFLTSRKTPLPVPVRRTTLAHRAFSPLQRILPGFLSRGLRAAIIAALTPLYFAYQTGHFRSSLRSKAVDKSGTPIPWYTYPAIELLRTKSFKGKRVLEFGAGQSTIWWAQKAERVTSFEADAGWYKHIRTHISQNTTLHLVDDQLALFEEAVSEDARFDVVIIDGLDRFVAASKSLERLAPGGVFIVDNSEGYWGPVGTYPIIDLFREAGYSRVDFYGFSPGTILQHCTSFFFRGKCFLFETQDYPVSLGTVAG